jgi:hypothetical protein
MELIAVYVRYGFLLITGISNSIKDITVFLIIQMAKLNTNNYFGESKKQIKSLLSMMS